MIVLEYFVFGKALKEQFMHGNCLLERSQVFTETKKIDAWSRKQKNKILEKKLTLQVPASFSKTPL